MHFSKIFWGSIPPDPSGRLMPWVLESALHTAGESTYT